MPATNSAIKINKTAKSRLADPRMAPVCYGLEAPAVVVSTELKPTASGTLAGSVHLSAENLASTMGIACADLAQNVTSVTFTDCTSNIAEHTGISLFMGDPESEVETAGTFSTHDRICAAYSGCDVQAVHGMINPAAGNGNVAVTSTAGEVRCAFDNVKPVVETAAIRTAKYGGEEAITAENFASSCTKIQGANGEERWMVPTSGHGTCAVSKLVANNIKTNSDFCNGRYAGSKAAVVNDLNGRPCTIVTSSDFDTVTKAFWQKCTPSGAFSKGITARFETMTPFGDDHVENLQQFAGRPPTVSARLTFNRPTTAATLGAAADELMNPHTQNYTTAATMTGESAPKEPVTMESITQAVLAAKISPGFTPKDTGAVSSVTGTVSSTTDHVTELVEGGSEA